MKNLLNNRFVVGAFALLLVGVLMAVGVRDETPLGTLEGTAAMAENSKGLPGVTVVLRPQFEIPDWHTASKTTLTKGGGRFRFTNVPAGAYTIEAYAKAHAMKETKFAVVEGKNPDLGLELQPGAPHLKLNAAQHVFSTHERPTINVEGFGFDDRVALEIYSINLDRLIKGGGLQSMLSAAYRWSEGVKTDDRTVFAPKSSMNHTIIRRDAEGSFVEDITLPALGNGFYWVGAASSNLKSGTWVAVSDIALITKKSGRDILCYVTDIQTGAPIPGAAISIHQKDVATSPGKSDGQGMLRLALPANFSSDANAAIVAKRQNSTAIVAFTHYAGDEGVGLRAFIYTDRPIYRPGDEISYKCILRRLVADNYSVPMATPGVIEIRDPDDNLLETKRLSPNGRGSVWGSFKLSSEALTGSYSIKCKIGGFEESKSVPIAAYRKPEYTVKVRGSEPYFVLGDTASATINSQYYFGGPVVGAKVTAYIYRAPDWSSYTSEEYAEEYQGEEFDSAGELVKTVEAETNGQGEATVSFDTNLDGQDPETDYIYTISADVADAGGKFYSGEGKVKIVRGEFSLSLETDDYILQPSGTTNVTVTALSHTAKRPIANALVRIVYGYETWDGNNSIFAPSGENTLRTNQAGIVTLPVTAPQAGSFIIKSIAKDRRSNEIEARQYIYVTDSSGFDFSSQPGKVSLVVDKKQYKVGEKAQVLINSQADDASALLTVEGGDIEFSKLVSLSKGSALIELPIRPSYAPNTYINVAFVSNKKFYENSKRLSVDLSQKLLQISIEADKPVYKPKEKATYRISTKDGQGRPVPAELSFGVVDESIYAIRKDDADIVNHFYPKRRNAVETYYSFPEIYLGDGDKDVVAGEVRERFLDTAMWRPSVITNAQGQATVSVDLPDNVTSWRATATGITSDSLVGKVTSNVVARKPVMVRLQAPRFFTQGDHVQISAMVHNNTGARQEVTVALAAQGIHIDGDIRQSVSVGTDAPETVTWFVRAPRVGSAVITAQATARTGGSDAERRTIPIEPYGRKVVANYTGDVRSDGTVHLSVHQGYVPGTGNLTVNLAPSLGSSLLGSLEYLVGYPYGCTEQTMSRFLPSVVVSSTLKQLGISQPGLQAQLPDMIEKGFLKLRAMQHTDGGWGWWEYDQSDPWMTAYVLEGYYRAAKAGFAPPKFSRDNAIGWAKNTLNELERTKMLGEPDADSLHLIRALALNGQTDFCAQKVRQVNLGKAFTPELLIPLVITYNTLGEEFATEEQTAVTRLAQMAEAGPSRASWKESWYGVETSAQAVLAIATSNPQHPILPKAIRWLMLQRRGDHWFSTRDTSFVLLALAKYMTTNEEAAPNYGLDILFNGNPFKSILVTPASAANNLKVDVPFTALRAGDNRIDIRITGQGNCYYSIESRQVVNTGKLAQTLTGEDLRVERAYHRLQVRRLDDGTMRLLPSKDTIGEIDAGDLIRVILTINSDKEREFMMIEDPVPSGCEITERENPDDAWERWWSRTDIRDDKIVFFARRLPPGVSTIEYTMRAELPGLARAMPTTLSNMYDPDVRASTGEQALEVKR
ncbi:MAG: hypothetical protein H0W86_04100 [Armatimonadetes bacterium]|nr:hypothetical protein [Armatimonadota bacterium]